MDIKEEFLRIERELPELLNNLDWGTFRLVPDKGQEVYRIYTFYEGWKIKLHKLPKCSENEAKLLTHTHDSLLLFKVIKGGLKVSKGTESNYETIPEGEYHGIFNPPEPHVVWPYEEDTFTYGIIHKGKDYSETPADTLFQNYPPTLRDRTNILVDSFFPEKEEILSVVLEYLSKSS
jgi:hypothetical protein